jgi:hypothetical protein
MLKKVLRGLAVMALATFSTVGASKLLSLGAFTVTTPLGVVAFSAALTGIAWTAYNGIGLITSNTILKEYADPGVLQMTVLNMVASVISVLAITRPGVALSFSGGVVYAVVNTAIFWVFWTIGAGTGMLPAVKTFLPVRRVRRYTRYASR